MMLDKIGFYTLSDDRARNVSAESPLMRCELLLTDACNFRCPYCRSSHDGGSLPFAEAKETVALWAADGLKNIRFSGGEPTVYPWLEELVRYTRGLGVERIALSTNGSAKLDLYKRLVDAGVNDFSISLDACCAAYGDKIAGVPGSWERVVQNIRELSKLTYVTLGVVVTEETVGDLLETVRFAASLGPADIRIISAAQFNQILEAALEIPEDILDRFPILRYRVENLKKGRNVRGLRETDSHRCSLVLDDMAVNEGKHFPCIIYMRENGKAIGSVGPNMRKEREEWYRTHDTHKDPICKKNCLDVCIDHNNCAQRFRAEKAALQRMSPVHFTYDLWRAGSIHDLGIESRFPAITALRGREQLRAHAVGWCPADRLTCRAKDEHIAVMCFKDDEHFWFHVRTSEFVEVFA